MKTAAEILAEIGDEHAQLRAELSRPLKQPNRHGNLIRTNRYPVKRKSTARQPRKCELVPGCLEPHVGKGGCATHRYRLRRYGDPLAGDFTRANKKKEVNTDHGRGADPR